MWSKYRYYCNSFIPKTIGKVTKIQEGDSAIDFELSASDGTIIKLSSFKGNQREMVVTQKC